MGWKRHLKIKWSSHPDCDLKGFDGKQMFMVGQGKYLNLISAWRPLFFCYQIIMNSLEGHGLSYL